MKSFSYRAKDQVTGAIQKGTVQADNERVAGKLLLERGLMPESIREKGTGVFEKLNKVTSKDRINFTRQFSTLVGAGLPIAQSLRTVAEQTSSKPMKAVIEEITSDVEAGHTLGESFGKHDDVFSNVYLSLIRAGEVSGTLDESLKRIAMQEEKDEKMMSKIRGAMMYPLIVLGVIIGVFIYMMVAVVPEVEGLYDDLGKELPFFTGILVGIKDIMFKFWWLILICLGILVVGFNQFRKTDVGIKTMAIFKLNVPLFNNLFRILYMSRYSRIAQILLATGVSVLDTMAIAGNSTNNVVVKKSIDDAAQEVQGGKAMSAALKGKDYILPLVYQMAAIGEQSGKMDEMLGKAAQVYEDELDEKISAISTAIEPVLMVAMAVLAGGLVGGILLPIYSLVNDITG